MDERMPIPRPASRVLLLDDDDRLLLFRIPPEGAVSRRTVWLPPGGGVQEGETYLEAAVREVWEETGLQDVAIGPCVWRRSHVFEFGGRLIEQREQYFVARCAWFEVVKDNWEAHEHTFMAEHRWWRAEEVIESDDWFVPRRLAAHLPDIVAGRFPAEPFDIGV
jgi:8-oxo-dGTP pyrophosphatase MutT (NUDIX family)